MTIQVQKVVKKVDVLQAPASVLSKQEMEFVDEIAALEKQLAPMRPLIKRYEEIKKTLSSVALDAARFNKDQVAVLRGSSGIVEFKPESNPREISDMHGLIGAMKTKMGGYEPLLDIIKINLGDVDKYLTEAEAAPFIGNKKEGSRVLAAVRTKGE